MHVVGEAPIKELVTKQGMQAVIILLSILENKLANQNQNNEELEKMLEYEINDFKNGFERRVLMTTSSSFILNCPVNLLNGSLLKKLIKSGNF